jgi:hypothetical protein
MPAVRAFAMPRRARDRFELAVVMTALLGSSSIGSAQPIDEKIWTANGDVRTVVRDGRTIYIGGQFTHVGPVTGSGVPIDLVSGRPPSSFPRVVGQVLAVTPDGTGGWFIGGSFSSVGGRPRSNIAHVLSDFTVSDWNPSANSSVQALGVVGSTVYAAGFFTNIGGAQRPYVAALDGTTGAATTWNPSADQPIRSLAATANAIYVGGYFTQAGGLARAGLAALDASTGAATSWNPGVSGSQRRVNALVVRDSVIYVGGEFLECGGTTRRGLAALSITSGVPTNWYPWTDGEVVAIAVSGSTVYVGGYFNHIRNQARNHVAAVTTAGALTSWDPNANNSVRAIAVVGRTVLVGGAFGSIGGQARDGIAALDATTGAATPWNPTANGWVHVLAVNGHHVYAGGSFSSIGGQNRNYIAALDAETGAATSWNPDANGYIYDLEVSGSTVYACGGFEGIGGQSRHRVAALDAVTGNATGWNPAPNGEVWELLPVGSTVYVGGTFTSIGGQPRHYIAALDVESGLAMPWAPNADNVVQAIAVSGSTVYAGGWFTNIGGQARNLIAALDAVSGAATPWNPDAGATGLEFDPYVKTLAVSGSMVYAGGYFNRIGGQSRAHLAALDATTGSATAWDPGGVVVDGPTGVNSLVVAGSTVYAGGAFTWVGGQARNYLAALDAASGAATTWDPNADWLVEDVAVNGSTVYAGGRFGRVAASPVRGLAAIRDATLEAPGPEPRALRLLNFPNPFQKSTEISFTLRTDSRVTLEIFDLAGRAVATLARDEPFGPGTYRRAFQGSGLPSGLYLSRLRTEREVLTGRMLLLE